MKKYIASAILAASLLGGCNDADMASHNISRAADNFQINRRIIFVNGITDRYLLTIEGLCALGNYDEKRKLTVTCKTGPETYKKHYLGLSDNVTFFLEQLEPAKVGVYHYKVVLRPSAIIPDIDVK